MKEKFFSAISYLTILGWIIIYLTERRKAGDLLKFHLRQSLGVGLLGLVINTTVIFPILARFALLFWIIIAYIILGVINSFQGKFRPVPLLGMVFEKIFYFVC